LIPHSCVRAAIAPLGILAELQILYHTIPVVVSWVIMGAGTWTTPSSR
jgi:hypothetical protein